ncbi:hypothetical protein ACFWIB_43210, partial [Streptomyces sp. NPDC127051]|uniref:hypothetical protein n=1 Tax=Streptomyces sp. NPDC127051 TaxID=3347119 RepID=UPI00365E9D7F
MRFTTGWTITGADEKAIAKLPEQAWGTSLKQNGDVRGVPLCPSSRHPCRVWGGSGVLGLCGKFDVLR